jgi:hypothetical protein
MKMNPDPDLNSRLGDLKEGGWVMAALGAIGALVRLLVSEEDLGWVIWFRRILGGGMIGIVAYFSVHGLIEPLYEAMAYSISGSFAPEIIEGIRLRIKQFRLK